MIFGEAQTINSATYQYVEVISILRKLDNSHALDIFVKEAKALFVGQSYELLWTRGQECPSFAQYFAMIDGSMSPSVIVLEDICLHE
jgi:ophiobolin F synthase